MTKIIATNKGNNEFIQSITLMLGTSNKIDSVEQYLEQPVNKLVMLVKTDELEFDSKTVPKVQDVSSILRGAIC